MNALRGIRFQELGIRSKGKKGSMLSQTLIHIILVGIIFVIFFMAIAGQVNGRDVKQQVLEKQIALLIDSSDVGMSFEIRKINVNGFVSDVGVKNGRVFVVVDGFSSIDGYPYFSKHSVSVVEEEGKFRVEIR